MLCIIRRITTCNKIKINCQVFQTKHGLCPASLFAVVCNIVAASSNIIHTFPNIVSDNIPEIFRINKALQIVLIRHIQLLFNRVHPFYRKFHRLRQFMTHASGSIKIIFSADTATSANALNFSSLFK